MIEDHSKDLDWAYSTPEPQQKRRTRRKFVAIGKEMADRGLRYYDMLLYMKAHPELTQDQRDAIDSGYRRNVARGEDQLKAKPIQPKKLPKKKTKKKAKKRKSKSRRKTGFARDYMLHWQFRNVLGRYQRKSDDVPMIHSKEMVAPSLADLRADAKDLLIPWVELRRRYPMSLSYRGARILFKVVIDRERMLGLACKLSLEHVAFRPLTEGRVPPSGRMSRYKRQRLAELKRLAETSPSSEEPVVSSAKDPSSPSPPPNADYSP